MHQIRYLLCIVMALSLQDCATSPKMSQELERGKLTFEAGNYQDAFRELMPLAVDGKPEAQYAIGYMYYYGYGVHEDYASGLFWMQKSADQHYIPAIEALALIKYPQPQPPTSIIPVAESPREMAPRPVCRSPRILHDDQDQVLQSLPRKAEPLQFKAPAQHRARPAVTSSAAPATAQALPETGHPAVALAETSATPPIASQPVEALSATPTKTSVTSPNVEQTTPKQYALQLYGSYQLEDVQNVQKQLALKNQAAIWHTQHDGKDWYVLTYGQFPSVHEAKLEKANLATPVQQLNPWIRDLHSLERV